MTSLFLFYWSFVLPSCNALIYFSIACCALKQYYYTVEAQESHSYEEVLSFGMKYWKFFQASQVRSWTSSLYWQNIAPPCLQILAS